MNGIRIGPILFGVVVGNTAGVLAYAAFNGFLPWWPLAVFVLANAAFSAWHTSESHAWRAARRAYQRRTKENT